MCTVTVSIIVISTHTLSFLFYFNIFITNRIYQNWLKVDTMALFSAFIIIFMSFSQN